MHKPTDSFWPNQRACSGSNHSLPSDKTPRQRVRNGPCFTLWKNGQCSTTKLTKQSLSNWKFKAPLWNWMNCKGCGKDFARNHLFAGLCRDCMDSIPMKQCEKCGREVRKTHHVIALDQHHCTACLNEGTTLSGSTKDRISKKCYGLHPHCSICGMCHTNRLSCDRGHPDARWRVQLNTHAIESYSRLHDSIDFGCF